jgi:hypothetical protein
MQNHIAKWTGNADALGDSGITETAGGDIGIGTPAPGGVFDLQRNNAATSSNASGIPGVAGPSCAMWRRRALPRSCS